MHTEGMYVNKRKVSVTPERLEDIEMWLKEWAADEDNMILAQFCSQYGIGFPYLKYFTELDINLKNTYDTVISILCARWLVYAMTAKEMPQHMQKVIMKYLKAYDHHSFDMELEARKAVAKEENKSISIADYVQEGYADEKLQGVFKQQYDLNVNKRRGREAA